MIKFPKTADHLIGWLLGLVAASAAIAFALDFLFLDPVSALAWTFGPPIPLFAILFAVSRNEIISAIPPALLSLAIAGISVATLKESQEACEIIGRYQAIRQKHGLDAEKIQLHCPDGLFERSVRSSDRFDKGIGEKVFVLESITGLKRL